jgi:hypothetical protein
MNQRKKILKSLQYVNGGRMVDMNYKIKQCNYLKIDDKLKFLDDLVEAHICEIWFVKFVHHLQMLLLSIVYHLDCLCRSWTFLFAQIYFVKDMIQEKINFLTSPLFKNNTYSCSPPLFYPYSHAIVYVS